MISYRRSTDQPAPAGVHALLIGISDYPYLPDGKRANEGQGYDLGMRQLRSPALSAVKLARWLLREEKRLPQPLASIRLLIAPSDAERELIAKLEVASEAEREMLAACAGSSADDCTARQVKPALNQWRRDCATNRENVAWFYFAGHGIQLHPQAAVMLLAGYNVQDAPVLGEALSFDHILRGMEVTIDFKKMAQQQHFVIDACRTEYKVLRELLEDPPRPWSWNPSQLGKRSFATIFGTTSRNPSFGSTEGTVLSQALLRALQGEAADAELDDASNRVWKVKHYRLLEALEKLVGQIAEQLGETQTIEPGPMNGNLLWSNTPDIPILPVFIELKPPDAHPPETLFVQAEGAESQPTGVDVSRHPYRLKLKAGLYSATVNFPRGHAYRSCQSGYRLYAQPPWSSWRIPLAAASVDDVGQFASETGRDVPE